MPSSDYGNAVGGGLKLKGAKDAGVKKSKRKEKKVKAFAPEDVEKLPEQTALQDALAEEENAAGDNDALSKQRETEVKDYGKTEAQKRHEERRRKRVRDFRVLPYPSRGHD